MPTFYLGSVGPGVATGEIEDNAVTFEKLFSGAVLLKKTGVSIATGDFQTGDAPWVDVTNPAILTISGLTASETYTVVVLGVGHLMGTGDTEAQLQMLVDGTAKGQVYLYTGATVVESFCLVGIKEGITGKTTFDIKFQIGAGGGLGTTTLHKSTQETGLFALVFRTG